MSRKDGLRLPYRGTLACNFLELVDMHPKVRSIDPDPRPIQWWSGTEWEAYRARYGLVLDAGNRRSHRKVDVEVIAEFELAQQAPKWRRIRHAYRDEGRTLLIFTNRSILAEPRLTNAMMVNSYAGDRIVPLLDKDAIRSATDGLVTFTVNGLVEMGVLPYGRAYGAVLNLVASGELGFALGRLFDGNTPVSRRFDCA
jgi:hypothetical protein